MTPRRTRKVSLRVPPARGVDAIYRHFEDHQRKRGRLREIVLKDIKAGGHPSRQDLAAALTEPPPDPVARVVLTREEERIPIEVRHISAERTQQALERDRKAIAADTAVLCAYVACYYVQDRSRKPGRKASSRTVDEELRIAREYFLALDLARRAREADSRRPRAIKTTVQLQIARKEEISRRTLQQIIKGMRAKIY